MAHVLHRTTGELRESVNTPDYSPAEWLINPDLAAVTKVPRKFWKVVGDAVEVMTANEQAEVFAAELLAAKLARADAITAEALRLFEARYPLWSQTMFLGIQVSAIAAGRINQAIYCGAVTQFAGAALAAATVAHAEIGTAETVEDVATVTLLQEWLALDPKASVLTASQIED